MDNQDLEEFLNDKYEEQNKEMSYNGQFQSKGIIYDSVVNRLNKAGIVWEEGDGKTVIVDNIYSISTSNGKVTYTLESRYLGNVDDFIRVYIGNKNVPKDGKQVVVKFVK